MERLPKDKDLRNANNHLNQKQIQESLFGKGKDLPNPCLLDGILLEFHEGKMIFFVHSREMLTVRV